LPIVILTLLCAPPALAKQCFCWYYVFDGKICDAGKSLLSPVSFPCHYSSKVIETCEGMDAYRSAAYAISACKNRLVHPSDPPTYKPWNGPLPEAPSEIVDEARNEARKRLLADLARDLSSGWKLTVRQWVDDPRGFHECLCSPRSPMIRQASPPTIQSQPTRKFKSVARLLTQRPCSTSRSRILRSTARHHPLRKRVRTAIDARPDWSGALCCIGCGNAEAQPHRLSAPTWRTPARPCTGCGVLPHHIGNPALRQSVDVLPCGRPQRSALAELDAAYDQYCSKETLKRLGDEVEADVERAANELLKGWNEAHP